MNVELLAPAGNTEALDAAVNEGADAVYLGLKTFNARMRSSNFAWNQFEAAVDSLHKRNKKVYVTVNTVLTEEETEKMYRFLKYLASVSPDGIIVQDLGIVQMAKTYFPGLRLHASTQMNIASAKAANALSRFGISRVVLARELSLKEIEAVNLNTSCELEVFVHGALCVCQSGLCMFSSYLGGKSANRGMCAQACRRLYTAHTPQGDKDGYYFSPHDLQLIDYVPDLIRAGVSSFKIEGRMKSAEYVGTVVSAYRHVIDNWEKNKKEAVETGRRILAGDFARKKTSFLFVSSKAEEILSPNQAGGTGIFLGTIDKTAQFKIKEVEGKTKEDPMRKVHYVLLKGGSYTPDFGDSIRLHTKDDRGRESWKIQDIRVEKSAAQKAGSAEKVWIQVPADFGIGDSVYLLQTKSMSKRYPPVLPKTLSPFRKRPGDDKLPELKLYPEGNPAGNIEENTKASAKTGVKKRHEDKRSKNILTKSNIDIFPDGFYVQVSSVNSLHTILSDKPVRVIINLNEDTKDALAGTQKNGKPLPFSKREIFISLDPFMGQAESDELELYLFGLIEKGYTQFVINNPAHITMLKNKNLNLVAGPYLYSFNRWAVKWLQENNILKFISPIENSQKNLEEVYTPGMRKQVLIPVFAYPALFRMRFTLPKTYDFLYFSDKQGEAFKTFSTPSASFVLPEKPFSITDRIGALEKKGFDKFLLDFSHTEIERSEYRYIVSSCRNGSFIEDTSRFNWKEGFYDPVKIEARKQK
ncbi:peptidase U32 family protein [Treponema putidum]|uniref:U32 family peptidase n=1 Tax=Treponema putidum TaxID=221027 RepID=A0AAE9MQJ8_9SPIR|nr:peptidase U32 family protein [Treponema putidum]AIN93767.1 peptidase U32 [Treponema putidum]TWI77872.1 putative protease [Treponema putidum]UTY27708.1 U32 family peptidase [Treponema putidum]UTY30165.1 U32 family peptidase [Treponema putidum]UTY32624.1 U32 family peptidase [Treponema putidum]